MKQFYNILIAFFLILTGIDSFGQGVKKVDFDFQVEGKTYQGSFSYTFKYFHTLAKDKQKLTPGNYSFNIAKTGNPKLFILNITGIRWAPNIPAEIAEDLALVIQKEWIVKDGNGVLHPKFRPACLYSGRSTQYEYHYEKDGKGKSKISYGIKLPGKDCKDQVVKNGAFEFSYEIDSKEYIEIPIKTEPATPASTDEPATIADEEERKWKNCQDFDYPIPCLNSYLSDYPNGKYAVDAKARVDSYLWSEAESKNTVAAFQEYLRISPTKEHRSEAEDKIATLTPDAPTPKVEEKEDPVEVDWKTARKVHSVSGYKTFLSKHKKSKYAAIASKYTNEIQVLQLDDEQGNDVYKLTLTNVFRPRIDSIVPDSGVRIDRSKFNARNNFEFVVSILDARPHTLYFSDKTKPREFSRKSFLIDNLLKAGIETHGDTLLFSFEKGTPPYAVYFKKGNQFIHSVNNISANNYEMSLEEIRTKLESSDTLSVEAWDRRGNAGYSLKTVFVEKDTFPWHYVVAGIAALGLLFFFRKIFKNNEKKKLKALNEKRKIEQGIQSKKEPVTVAKKPVEQEEEHVVEVVDLSDELPASEAPLVEASDADTPMEEPENLMDEKGSGLKIKKVRKAHLPKESISAQEETTMQGLDLNNYYLLSQSEHWEDTIISKIGFSKKSIFQVDKFLREQNAQTTDASGELMEEVDGSIPEIGGLLMGNCMHFQNKNHYIVTVEEFIPINPEFNNVYKLEFSTQSLAKELGNAQDEFPDLALVGWFHTHPGHGLFLSKPDLTIHEGFFREPYQFAMEIDSRTVNFDTGFFTRKKDGQVNNREHKKLHSTWFAWTEIEKFMRQKG